MLLEAEDVKKIPLSQDDILWVRLSEDASMSDSQQILKSLHKMLLESGRSNKVVVTTGDVEFHVISDPTLKDRAIVRGANGKSVIIENIGTACDCGGAKTSGTHADYCATKKVT